MEALECTICNRSNLFQITQTQQDIFLNAIPLFHLNCPPQLNCPHRILRRNTPNLHELQTAVLQVLSMLCLCYNRYGSVLILEHHFISHNAPHIITLANITSLPKILFQNQIQLIQNPSPKVVAGAVTLLASLCYSNLSYVKLVVNTPGLIRALFKLVK
ncbi:MAG: hypothetical protein EZS28_056343, partial [Streblomastix strix]